MKIKVSKNNDNNNSKLKKKKIPFTFRWKRVRIGVQILFQLFLLSQEDQSTFLRSILKTIPSNTTGSSNSKLQIILYYYSKTQLNLLRI